MGFSSQIFPPVVLFATSMAIRNSLKSRKSFPSESNIRKICVVIFEALPETKYPLLYTPAARFYKQFLLPAVLSAWEIRLISKQTKNFKSVALHDCKRENVKKAQRHK